MKRMAGCRSCGAAALLWSCVALFAARVIGQIQAWLLAPDWLPAMDAWCSGLLPYHLLLPAQIGLLMLMAIVAWNRRVRTGAFAAQNPRAAGALRIFAAVYFTAMAVRLGVNVIDNGAEFWRHGAIPVAFHWVLALFLLVSGRKASAAPNARLLPAEDDHEHGETYHVAYGDVPAFPQPLTRAHPRS
jgi:hypothetical protein